MQIEMRESTIEGKKRLALIFPYDINTINLIKQIEGRRWSASNKFWHLPYREDYLQTLNKQFKGKLEFVIQKTEIKAQTIKVKFPPEYFLDL